MGTLAYLMPYIGAPVAIAGLFVAIWSIRDTRKKYPHRPH